MNKPSQPQRVKNKKDPVDKAWRTGDIQVPQTRYNLQKSSTKWPSFWSRAADYLAVQCIIKKLTINHTFQPKDHLKYTINHIYDDSEKKDPLTI